MTRHEIFADEIEGRLHVAVLQKNVVQDLYVDPIDTTGAWASIYRGKVTKVDTKLDAAIVDLGNGLSGFLQAKRIHTKNTSNSSIADLVKPGEMLLVQIKSEAKKQSLHENHKLPRLNTKLRNIDGSDISTERFSNSLQNTGLLQAGPTALQRALHDYGVAGLDHLYVGNKKILDQTIIWSEKHAPELAASKRLRLHKPETGAKQLFDVHDIYTTLEDVKKPHIGLTSGGSVIIEQTHALAVIDVNQGNSGSVLGSNREASIEIARQIRLRSLSGAILIDFISMPQKSDRSEIVSLLEKLLADDRAQAQVHGFTRLGIVEITRKRRTETLTEKYKH